MRSADVLKPSFGRKVAVAAAGAGMSVMALIGCSSTENIPAPTPTVTTPKTGLDRLNEKLGDVTQIIGPVAVNWDECPEGGKAMPADFRVNANIFNEQPFNKHPDATGKQVEIDNVFEYTDRFGNIVAWCGKSIGYTPKYHIDLPEKGTTLVIPAIPGCEEPELGGVIPCPGMPLTYNDSPNTTPGTVPLGRTPTTRSDAV